MYGKINFAFMVFSFFTISILYFYFGYSFKAATKYLALETIRPILKTTEAKLLSRTIFQATYDNHTASEGDAYKHIETVETYWPLEEFQFEVNKKLINTFDGRYFYFGNYGDGIISKMINQGRVGNITFKFLDPPENQQQLPWFLREKKFDPNSETDSIYKKLLIENSFKNKDKSVTFQYIPFAPHWNTLEAVPPSLALFILRPPELMGLFIAVLMLGQIWTLGCKDFFQVSRLTSIFAWCFIIIFVLIFVPARSLPSILKNKKYTSTFTLDENTIHKIELPSE